MPAATKINIEIRPARFEDAQRIVTLIESSYRGESGRRGWTTESDLIAGQRTDIEEIQQLLEHPTALFLSAWIDNRLVACCLLDNQAPAAYFGMFAVDPSTQGQGLGDTMLQAAERYAQKNWNTKKMTMSVIWVRAELIAWYQRRGYQKTEQQLPFPYENPRAGTPLRDDLYFIVLEKELDASDKPGLTETS